VADQAFICDAVRQVMLVDLLAWRNHILGVWRPCLGTKSLSETRIFPLHLTVQCSLCHIQIVTDWFTFFVRWSSFWASNEAPRMEACLRCLQRSRSTEVAPDLTMSRILGTSGSFSSESHRHRCQCQAGNVMQELEIPRVTSKFNHAMRWNVRICKFGS
jgi:hypothetical protein